MTNINAEELLQWLAVEEAVSPYTVGKVITQVKKQMIQNNACVCKRCMPHLYPDDEGDE